jgi:recombination DNA repair RAD52 pathway protein
MMNKFGNIMGLQIYAIKYLIQVDNFKESIKNPLKKEELNQNQEKKK